MLARFLLAVMLVLAAATLPSSAYAKPSKQEMALAKKAEREAKKHEKAGDFEEAREAWQKAVDLNDTPGARIGLARAEVKLGHLLAAEEHLNKALEHKKINWGQKRKAKKELAELDKKIPTLKIEPPSDFSGTISVNDEQKDASRLAAPLRLDPGQHTVVAEADGYKTFSETVVLEEGDRKDLAILMTEIEKPAPAAPVAADDQPEKSSSSSTQKTLGWISIGVGVVGLAVGSYMGLEARSTRNELDDRCGSNPCSESERDLYDEGKRQANFATAGFIVGGVGLGLGTVLLLTAGSDDDAKGDQAGIEPVIGPARLGVRGRF